MSSMPLATIVLLAFASSPHSLARPNASAELGALAKIQGTVYYDIDEDGVFNPSVAGEVPLVGWKVQIESSGGSVATLFTDSEGKYELTTPPDPITFLITSVAPPPGFVGVAGGQWLPTSPTQASLTTTVPVVQIDFGNLFLISSPQFARGKSYWANEGREALFPCDPTWRRAINNVCLRENFTTPVPAQQATTIFTVSLTAPFSQVFAELGTFLNQPSNNVLAHILSKEFCAAKLNTECGPLEGLTVYINRTGNGVLVPLSVMIANTRAVLCDPRSANTGPGGNLAWMLVIEQCLMEWSQMGTSGTSIFTPSPDPVEYTSPY